LIIQSSVSNIVSEDKGAELIIQLIFLQITDITTLCAPIAISFLCICFPCQSTFISSLELYPSIIACLLDDKISLISLKYFFSDSSKLLSVNDLIIREKTYIKTYLKTLSYEKSQT
jgi:hypothetical protein